MYITKEQLDARLQKTEVSVVTKTRKERSDIGSKRLDHEDRVMLGTLSELMSQEEVAELAGVSPQTVSNAARGMTSPTIGVDKELRDDVDAGREVIKKDEKARLEQVKDQLLTNLAAAIGHVGNNLQSTDATEASKIAVDMSKILDRVSGTGGRDKGPRVAVIINAPAMKKEDSFQVINV